MVEDLVREVKRLQRKAEKAQRLRDAIAALAVALKGLETLAKLTGELDTRAQHHALHVHLPPERARAVAEAYMARHQLEGAPGREPDVPPEDSPE